ncbi:unnamed protein product [Rotaria sp. Silwood2]|nr:unnamed protein product [Rotaria sp. Silwood2]CAF4666088.1 unnamed protein product [Rotaria sp. Silwood2]
MRLKNRKQSKFTIFSRAIVSLAFLIKDCKSLDKAGIFPPGFQNVGVSVDSDERDTNKNPIIYKTYGTNSKLKTKDENQFHIQ